MTTKSTKEILIDARAVIESEDKWTRGALLDQGGCHCALGALCVAANIPLAIKGTPGADSAYDALQALDAVDVLAYATGGRLDEDAVSSVYAFNDANRTKHADVLAAFDKAIAACP